MPNLLYFAPEDRGGLADYGREQANALQACGVNVTLLTPAIPSGEAIQVSCHRSVLGTAPNRAACPSKLSRRVKSARTILRNMNALTKEARVGKFRHILFAGYFEYLAPLWAPRLKRLAGIGVVFGSVVHDPLRDFVVGPLLWHRWSTACGYSFLRDAFVHEPIVLPTVRPQPQLRTTVIPHGPYRFSAATVNRKLMRERLQIPQAAHVLLAFGHLRDSKNLHLALEAMQRRPEFYLLVAGRELGATQKTAAYYQQRARDLGVAARCRWDIRDIPSDEVGNLFEATDLVLLTYNAAFSSASGVLNIACHFRKPCLASGGKSNLRTVLESYSLGYWVEPDSFLSIAAGLKRWLHERPCPDWTTYEQENSWSKNAEIVANRLFSS